MKEIYTVFLCFLLWHPLQINAQSVNNVDLPKSVDSLIATQFKLNEPGISVLIANRNGVIYKKAFGSANVELNVPSIRPLLQ